MSRIHAIPRATQRDEPWANGAGTTIVVLREPDGAEWTVRASVAFVGAPGPFSEWSDTRRLLVPLDGRMTLRFNDDRELSAARLGILRFDGTPAPHGELPDGPTRDFNLMLRGAARGDVWPRTLVDSIVLPPAGADRWLVYLARGEAQLHSGDDAGLELCAGDAALLTPAAAGADHATLRGAGEIVLVRLYA